MIKLGVLYSYLLAAMLVLLLSVEVPAHDLSWTYTPGAVSHTGFTIYRQKAGEPAFTPLAKVADTVRSYVDPDRTIGNCYRVTAFNAFGESSPVGGCAAVPDGAITVLVLK